MQKIIYYMKQLLPLKYHSKCIVQNTRKLAIWTQWFGKPYNIQWFTLAD